MRQGGTFGPGAASAHSACSGEPAQRNRINEMCSLSNNGITPNLSRKHRPGSWPDESQIGSFLVRSALVGINTKAVETTKTEDGDVRYDARHGLEQKKK